MARGTPEEGKAVIYILHISNVQKGAVTSNLDQAFKERRRTN